MGNLGIWIRAISLGIAWGAFMTFHVRRGNHSISLSKLSAGYLSYGLWLGLLVSFGWQAFRVPVLLVTAPSAACGLFLLWSAKFESAKSNREALKG
jgi:hypothetical protein